MLAPHKYIRMKNEFLPFLFVILSNYQVETKIVNKPIVIFAYLANLTT